MKLQVVPAATGVRWVRDGMRVFGKQPIAMGALFFLFVITISVPTIVPVLGLFVGLSLVPATTVGLMAGAREVDAGRLPTPLVLFVALRQGKEKARQMLLLGALYALAVLVVIGLSMLIDGGQFARLYLGHAELTPEIAASPRLHIAMWTTLILYVPISLAFWHAPALVHWNAVQPVKSLFFSIVAILRNTRAFLLYGAMWAGLSGAASVALLLVVALSGSTALASASFVAIGVIIAAMFCSSLWFTYRDCFSPDDEAAALPS